MYFNMKYYVFTLTNLSPIFTLFNRFFSSSPHPYAIFKNKNGVNGVEQDALMSPNPSGKLEDHANVCVLFSCLKLVNSLLKMIQVQLSLYLF